MLLVPWAHAFQGDNPMQSEFASHIGMSGRHFCRVCHASKLDGSRRAPGRAGEISRVTEFMEVAILSLRILFDTDFYARQELHGQKRAHELLSKNSWLKFFGAHRPM